MGPRMLTASYVVLLLAGAILPFATGFYTAAPHHPTWGVRFSVSSRQLYQQQQQQQQEQETDERDSSALLRAVTFSNLPKDQEPGLLCDYLLEIGAVSVSITDADRGTDREQAIFGEPADTVAAVDNDVDVWASTRTDNVWDSCNVTAHFPASADLQSILRNVDDDAMRELFFPDMDVTYRVEQVPNKDWVIHVQQGWKPIVVANKFVLTFPWHNQTDIQQAADKQRQESTLQDDDDQSRSTAHQQLIELKLQGGIAFGTGEHATTQLCLEWIDRVVSQRLLLPDHVVVVDYGAGSGVLGLAACALAPDRVRAVGVDVDADCCRIANANAAQNQMNMQNYLPSLQTTESDDTSKSLLLKAQSRVSVDDETLRAPASELGTEQYDVCVANILAGALVGLAPTLYNMLRPGGSLGLSGILEPQGDMVVQAYMEAGFESVQVDRVQSGWVLITAQKPGN
jgi:ribosomal protein L11 methyltransferase